MLMAMRWTVAALALLVTACPGPSTGTKTTTPTFDTDRALLTIPVPAEAGAALERMAARAEAGDVASAWARAHYLLDLFDDARFRRDDASLRMLSEVIDPGGAAGRGPEATDRALDFLLLQVDAVLAADRLHAGAQAARTMLEFDTQQPTARNQLFQRMLELKSVARSSGPMADNAVLRMVGFCRQAMLDATDRAWAMRIRTVAHCLYPLYDSDPAPYFEDNPAARPPPPDVGDLLVDMEEMLSAITRRGGRLEFAAAYLIEQLTDFASTGASELPVAPERGSLGLPTVDAATMYDWTPVIAIGDGSQMPSVDELTRALIAEVAGDDRATVAVAASADAPARSLITVADAALRAGATRLELVVWIEQTLSVPKGDYWYGRIDGATVPRLGVIPVSLAVHAGLGAQAPAGPAQQQRWDPELAGLGVHLVVGPTEWVLTAPTGRIAAIGATDADSPERDLRVQLGQVRAAFGSEDGIVIVPGDGATMGQLIAAAAATYRSEDGRPSFSRIALSATAVSPTTDVLAQRIARRHGATVTITTDEPDVLQSRASVVRACYQDILDKAPNTAATVDVKADSDNVTATGPKMTKAVRACVIDGIGALMKVRGVTAATVALSPR